MIVADTSAWIDYVRGIDAPHTNVLDYELLHNRIITGDLIITEFLQGFREEKDFKEAKRIMDSLEYHDFAGREIALRAAMNFRKLRTNGITIRKTIDVIIATFCIENRYELIHNDRDFDPMEKVLGLLVRR
ncbi:MAG: twitching motility protein PilT [Deltaproteobacteria bacterium RIFOXYD12_FULL_57_12]|nr:MAG: twitching motility protein PilT [Deltaproteobacteria bacterium RIFOXYD12_FULL_57_12]